MKNSFISIGNFTTDSTIQIDTVPIELPSQFTSGEHTEESSPMELPGDIPIEEAPIQTEPEIEQLEHQSSLQYSPEEILNEPPSVENLEVSSVPNNSPAAETEDESLQHQSPVETPYEEPPNEPLSEESLKVMPVENTPMQTIADVQTMQNESSIPTSSDETQKDSSPIQTHMVILDTKSHASAEKKVGIFRSNKRMEGLSRPVTTKVRIHSAKPVQHPKDDMDDASIECKKMCSEFKCHYVVYVYSAPRNVDADTFPFRKNKCINKKLEENIDPVKRKELIKLKNMDKRLECIELRANCRIHLGKLNDFRSFLRGLPRRRLTIAAPTFINIAMALNMLENMFPRLLASAVYPYRLPAHASTHFNSGSRMASVYKPNREREPSNIGLRHSFNDSPIRGSQLVKEICRK